MSENTKKIKIYAKLFGIGLIFLIILDFVIRNRDAVHVEILGRKTPDIPKFIFVIVVANCGIVIFLIIRKLRGIIQEFKTLHQNKNMDKQ